MMDCRVKPGNDDKRRIFVKPAAFAYAKARSLDEAIALLGEQEHARVLAGGQSLVATLNMRLDAPDLLVDINGVPALDAIARRNGHVEIGALVRHVAAERSDVIARDVPLIARAMPHIGHPAIRNRGTIGGSIAFADPAAELPACLLALDGEVDIAGPNGTRSVKADDFFHGLFETALGPHDLLTAIRVPAAGRDMRYAFAELARRHGDYAMVGLAACARLDGGGLHDVRLVYFGVGATPISARRAAAALAGGVRDDARLDHAVAALADDLDPAGDVQATGKTKQYLAGVLLRRVVRELSEPVQ
jgi:carbon-monoxide dehydrogenase medium subunit